MAVHSRASRCRCRRRVRTTEKNEKVHVLVSRRERGIARHMAQVCPSRPIAREEMEIEEEERRTCINSVVNVEVGREQSIYCFSLYRSFVRCPSTKILLSPSMERDDRREMNDEHDEHTVGSLDTSMDRCLENHGLWRKRIPQGRTTDTHLDIVYSSLSVQMVQACFVPFPKR